MTAPVTRLWRLGVIAVAVAVVAAIATVLALRSSHASSAKSLARGQAIAVSAGLVPQSHLFGEPIQVRIDATIDRRRADPNRIVLHTNWAPYKVIGSQRPTRRDVGNYTELSWRTRLHCVESDCLPGVGSVRRFRFITASITSNAFAPVTIKWPEIAVVSRLDPVDLKRRPVITEFGQRFTDRPAAAIPPWRADTRTLDGVSYRLAPGLVFWFALAGGLLLIAAAGLFVRPLIPTPAWLLRWRPREPTPLERALGEYERACSAGSPADQRLALEHLAGELARSGEGVLAWTASELAWSELPPTADRGGVLTLGVRSAIERRGDGSNGRNGSNGR
jgi:hypothetical protein